MPQFDTQSQAIQNLQTYLRQLSYHDQSIKAPPIDGIFDNATRIALIDFQLRNSLAPTGIANRTTWELLYAQYLDIIKSSSLPNPIIPFPSYPDDYEIKFGEKSFLVATLQYMLNEIGIIYNTFDNLEITGVYDEATEKAIKDFQERGLLVPTGRVDRATWDSLARIYNLSLHYIEQY